MKNKYRTIPLEGVLSEFSEERKKRIRESAEQGIKDYNRLQKIFETLGVTQDDIIEKGDISYVYVSKPEKLTDSMIAFVKKRFEDCGFELKIKTKTKTNESAPAELESLTK